MRQNGRRVVECRGEEELTMKGRKGEKKRRLCFPFRDRVVHHALVRMLQPGFEPRFI